PTPERSPLSLHDALPIWGRGHVRLLELVEEDVRDVVVDVHTRVVDELERPHRIAEPELHRVVDVLLGRHTELEHPDGAEKVGDRSEEHTSELQSRENLVC